MGYMEMHAEVHQALKYYSDIGYSPAITGLSQYGLTDASASSSSRFNSNRQWRYTVRQDLKVPTSSPSEYSATEVPDGRYCTDFSASSLNQTCAQQAIASGADGLMATSYVASCHYVSSLALELVAEPYLCMDALRSFKLVFVAQGL